MSLIPRLNQRLFLTVCVLSLFNSGLQRRITVAISNRHFHAFFAMLGSKLIQFLQLR